MMITRDILCLVLVSLLLAACGQSGALYLPPTSQPEQHDIQQGK